MNRPPSLFLAVAMAVIVAAVSPVCAVILYRTADPQANTTAPTGALADSGWQFEGEINGFTGTPIAPDLFLTANHLGLSPGTPFTFQGVTYQTVARYSDPGSDLCVLRVDGTFPTYAPLFTRLNPAGASLVVFGRGTQRGEVVSVPADGTNLAGWRWGASDSRLRWGTNTVVGDVDGGPGLGLFLQATFDAGGGTEEAHLSAGDSGGGVFIRDVDGVWKLAGINYGVTGGYAYAADGSGSFNAAVFHGDGLYEDGGSDGYVPSTGPGSFYATEIAARLNFLRLVLGQVPLARIGNDVLFGFASKNGQTYRVEGCDDLAAGNWTTVADNVPGNGGRVIVTDAGAAGQPQRFYRVVTSP